MKNNIAKIRKARGLSQTELAARIGSTLSMVGKLERAERPVNSRWLQKLSAELGVRPDELVRTTPGVPVIGYVGAGAKVFTYDDLLDAGDTIDQPPMVQGDLLAVEVKGDSMLPLAEEGWHIVYTAEATVDENLVLNRVCVVQLDADDSMMVKRVTRGSRPYHYHLLSLNAPMIEDVRLRWAAVVKAIVPR